MIIYTFLTVDKNGVPCFSITAPIEDIHQSISYTLDNLNVDEERQEIVLGGKTLCLDARMVDTDFEHVVECDFDEFMEIANQSFVDFRNFMQWFNEVGGVSRETK